MNDFTKEELYEILGLASNAYGIKGRTMPIIVKLQSMIDTYCEHEWECKDIGRVEKCIKCEKINIKVV